MCILYNKNAVHVIIGGKTENIIRFINTTQARRIMAGHIARLFFLRVFYVATVKIFLKYEKKYKENHLYTYISRGIRCLFFYGKVLRSDNKKVPEILLKK